MRPRAAHTGKVSINRESSALRASVMDIAMEIGLGMNGAVTDWVYNNPINEEEEEPVTSPSLTTGSSINSDAYSSTSSARFPYSPPASSRSISSSIKSLTSLQKPFSPSAFSIPEESSSIFQTDTEPLCATPTPPVTASITFSDPPMQLPLSVRLPAKLKKRRTDGYESESGYISDTKGKKKDKKEKVSKTGESSGPSASDDKARAKEEKELAKRQKEAARQRVKSLTSKRSAKDVKVADSLASKGYETDAPTRKGFGKKKKSGDAGYETDAGYLSSGSPASGLKKAKTRFFRLSRKSSKPDLVASVPKAAPSIPLPLPIAQKFGTTLSSNGVEPLPVLPPLPSLDTDLLCTVPAENSASSNEPSLASPSPITPSGPLGRVKSASSGVRDSQLSGESSGSSISNASTVFSQESRASRLKSFRFLSPSKSSSALPPSKFPTISLPLTRATSPVPLDAGNNDANQCQDPAGSLSPDMLRSPKLYPSARGSVIQETRGRSPVSPASPAFLSPTSPQRSLSPALSSPVIISTAASPPSSPAISRAPSFKPQANLTVNTSHNLSPLSLKRLSRGRSPSPIPSSEWIVPSPPGTTQSIYASSTTLPVPSPNIYSVYDIPPPSPPPNTPLPKVPVVAKNENDVEDDPFGVNGTSVIRSLNQPERGKDLSFLARLRGQSVSNNNTKTSERSLVQTIRRFSKQPITTPPSVISDSSSQRRSGGSTAEVYDDASGDQELQDVLDRFISELSSSGDKHEAAGTALGRRKSSEALRNDGPTSSEPIPEAGEDNGDDAESQHSPDLSRRRRSTVYYSDAEEDGADPRLSRWSGSIYSRASFMDPQKSEETRVRFVKRVEAMLDEAGIERGNRDWDAVPPVPKLPEALAQSNLLTRQNQMKGAGPTPNANGWI